MFSGQAYVELDQYLDHEVEGGNLAEVKKDEDRDSTKKDKDEHVRECRPLDPLLTSFGPPPDPLWYPWDGGERILSPYVSACRTNRLIGPCCSGLKALQVGVRQNCHSAINSTNGIASPHASPWRNLSWIEQ
jgi:hypothetical protein